MDIDEQVRHCRCGTRLARDNKGVQCNACARAARDHLVRPPAVPAEFWRTEEMRAALASCEMGAVIRAFRTHPHHGRCISQRIAAAWVGVTQTRLSRIENGERIVNLNKLTRWAHVLGIPADLLWFRMPRGDTTPQVPGVTGRSSPDRSAMSQLSRRALLTRAALALPALDGDEAEHVVKALADARRYLDRDLLRHFDRQISAVMAHDRSVGAREALPMALGLAGAVQHSARDVKADVRCSLLGVGARAAELCGWLYRELHEPVAEGFWLDRGMEWAQEAGDTAMQGYLLLKKSQMAYDDRDGLRVLTLARAAGAGPLATSGQGARRDQSAGGAGHGHDRRAPARCRGQARPSPAVLRPLDGRAGAARGVLRRAHVAAA
ncbi:transcriptional regulator with XRE-family HTH domain [Saccharothrix coeruleofusca]|uniref:helix-turn-helix domain-containing protein n=1 Tax=Saccharothrix coeruleofusca TaxID=33919 RepID=UPI001AE713A2|nr:helix-turn-helix transcriptional regulator [Saccharothrix coeruleofusca]MBP2336409.1 transcriptional regulator with XRE-family HTH domain [Saccharothrix coeruleofusca]